MEDVEAAGSGEVFWFYEAYVRRVLSKNDGVTLVVIQGLCPGLDIPESPGQLTALNIGRSLIPATPFTLTEDGIDATVSISRTPRKVFIPWAAVMRAGPINPPGGSGGIRKAA